MLSICIVLYTSPSNHLADRWVPVDTHVHGLNMLQHISSAASRAVATARIRAFGNRTMQKVACAGHLERLEYTLQF